jgi:hypothetical protein
LAAAAFPDALWPMLAPIAWWNTDQPVGVPQTEEIGSTGVCAT